MPPRTPLDSDRAVGQGGHPNTTIFFTGIERIRISREQTSMSFRPITYANGSQGWLCVLYAPYVPGGTVWEFHGVGARQAYAKDDACNKYNVEQGWVIRSL